MNILKLIDSGNRKLYRWFIGIIGLTQDKTTRNLFLLFQIAIISVLIILIIDLLSIKLDESISFGTFGDFFGGVANPILTFLTFMGLFVTIVLQQKELRLTREESRRSADALESAKNEAELQTKILLRNSQKADAFNFLNDSRKDLDKITSEIVPGSNETKMYFIFSTWGKERESGKGKQFDIGYLEGFANDLGFSLGKLSRSLELYYVSLYELTKLEVNHVIIDNYVISYEDHVAMLVDIDYFDPSVYDETLKYVRRCTQTEVDVAIENGKGMGKKIAETKEQQSL